MVRRYDDDTREEKEPDALPNGKGKRETKDRRRKDVRNLERVNLHLKVFELPLYPELTNIWRPNSQAPSSTTLASYMSTGSVIRCTITVESRASEQSEIRTDTGSGPLKLFSAIQSVQSQVQGKQKAAASPSQQVCRW